MSACPTCGGKGEVYAEAPWCRWLECGDCGGKRVVDDSRAREPEDSSPSTETGS